MIPNYPQSSVIKTRMQSLQAPKLYRNSFHCAYVVFAEGGILGFWKGTTPRLARLVVSSCHFNSRMLSLSPI